MSAPFSGTDPKGARLASAVLREWLVKALAERGEDPPEPWDLNDIPLVDHIAEKLHAFGYEPWPEEHRPNWLSPLKADRVATASFPPEIAWQVVMTSALDLARRNYGPMLVEVLEEFGKAIELMTRARHD